MEKRNKKLAVLLSILLVGIGVSFAAYSIRIYLRGEGAKTKGKTAVLGDTTITVEGELDFHDTNIYPGHQNLSSIKVTATGDRLVYYTVTWTGTNTLQTPLKYTVYKTTSEETPSITCEKKEEGTITTIYYETCTESNFDALGEAIDTGAIISSSDEVTVTLAKDYITASKEGTTVYYYVVIEFQDTQEEQNFDMNGAFSGEIFIELIETGTNATAKEYILAGKMVGERTDFSSVFPSPLECKEVELDEKHMSSVPSARYFTYADSYIFIL